MKVAQTFRISFKALGDRKVRTILTILMVIVGSSLMVTLNGIVAGLGQFATNVFNKLAPNILFITSFPTGPSEDGSSNNRRDSGGSPSFLGQGLIPVPSITLDKAVVIKLESLPYVSSVVPSYQGRITITVGNRSQTTSVLSTPPGDLKTIAPALTFTEGSGIKPADKSAIYLPLSIVQRLWKLPEASITNNDKYAVDIIGKQVNVTYTYIDLATASPRSESKTFTVAGIMKPVGNPTIDSAVVFNLDAGSDLFRKSGRYDSLFVVAQSTDQVSEVEKEIRQLYGSNIGITTSEAILHSIQDFTAGFSGVVSSIALVTLLVGSVGIITTMYTSVTERTREIGIMKAIGARDRNVLALFLAEAAIIGIIGASIGLVVGVLGGYGALSLFASNLVSSSEISPRFPWIDLARVWAISLGLSLAAGLYPAWKASNLSPIVALRRE